MVTTEELIAELGVTPREGSSVIPGVPYQNIPGISNSCHRDHSDLRADRIMELVDLRDRHVSDFGCSVGTITNRLGRKAKWVTGYDHDEASIAVAQSLKVPNASFAVEDLTMEFLDRHGPFDVVVWVSQFMWMVKQHGMEYALDFLWKLSTQCDTLIFETAARCDGSAPLDMRQEDIFALLTLNTVYQDIRDYGPWHDNWTSRNVFVAEKPIKSYRGQWSSIEFPKRAIVKKSFISHPFADELRLRELECLRALKCVPQVVSTDTHSIVMNYQGFPTRWIPESDLREIVEDLKRNRITHRDIRPTNVLWNGTHIVLIDFSFATIGDELTNFHYDLGGSYKCPYGFNDEYSLRKIQKELL